MSAPVSITAPAQPFRGRLNALAQDHGDGGDGVKDAFSRETDALERRAMTARSAMPVAVQDKDAGYEARWLGSAADGRQ